MEIGVDNLFDIIVFKVIFMNGKITLEKLNKAEPEIKKFRKENLKINKGKKKRSHTL